MHSLWRITPTPPGTADLQKLVEGLSLHLQYAPITTVLVQIGDRQQAYVAGEACPNCERKRCDSTCLMQLLHRLLLGTRAASDVRYLSLGLAQRPYTRLALAVPGPRARLPAAEELHPWREARLWACWRSLTGQALAGVALAVGADGPAPAQALRQAGWLALELRPALLGRPWLRSAPAPLPLGPAQDVPPAIMLPAADSEKGGPGRALLSQKSFSQTPSLEGH
jgi:hypothetical protein